MMRLGTRRIWVSLAVGAIIALLPILLDLFKAPIVPTAIFSSFPLWLDVVGLVVTASLISALTYWFSKLISPPDTSITSRQRILKLIENNWITGFLENRLYYGYDQKLLPLPLRERIGSRFDLVLSDPLKPTHSVLPDTTITQVFDQAEGELLILGEPGAGKTTLLLELTRDLLKRANDNPAAPIPVVLMLSSWAIRKLLLEEWIAEELKAKYDIPPQIGKAWVEANQLLLLLDGLDEVAPEWQPACIEAINRYYHQMHRSLAVCSRTKEYLDQPERLVLHTAVIVQPLSPEQVDTYLDNLATKGEDVEGLKHGLHQSEALRALVTTPFFLTVLTLAYHGKIAQELLALLEISTDQQHLLFQNYVERMLQREGKRVHAPAQKTKHWLSWLACQMTTYNQSEFYLKELRPDWLPKRQQAIYDWISKLFFIPLLGFFGLFYGLCSGLIFRLGPWQNTKIDSSSEAFIRFLKDLVIGLVVGLVVGLIVLVFVWLIGMLVDRFSGKQLTGRSTLSPNEGKLQNTIGSGPFFGSLVFGLAIGLYIGLFFGWLIFGLYLGLVAVLVAGLIATEQPYILRFWLWQAKCSPAPWHYVDFLDDIVDQQFLRKIGSGYIFRHRLLQDYFVSLDVTPPHDPSFHAEAHSAVQNAPNSDPSV